MPDSCTICELRLWVSSCTSLNGTTIGSRADPCLYPKVNSLSHSFPSLTSHMAGLLSVVLNIWQIRGSWEAYGWLCVCGWKALAQVVISLLYSLIFLVSFKTSALKACELGLVCQRHHQALQRQRMALIPRLYCHFLCSYKRASSQACDINHLLTDCRSCFDCGECGYTSSVWCTGPRWADMTYIPCRMIIRAVLDDKMTPVPSSRDHVVCWIHD